MRRSSHGVPGGSEVKASAWNVGDPGSIPGSGRSPGEGKWRPTPVLLPGKSHGGRSLVGYRPWSRKKSDTTEQLHFHFHFPLSSAFVHPKRHLFSIQASYPVLGSGDSVGVGVGEEPKSIQPFPLPPNPHRLGTLSQRWEVGEPDSL